MLHMICHIFHSGMIPMLEFQMIMSLLEFLTMIKVALFSALMSTESRSSEILPSINLSIALEPIGPSKFRKNYGITHICVYLYICSNSNIARSMNEFFCSVGRNLSVRIPQQPNSLLPGEYKIDESTEQLRVTSLELHFP